MTGFIGHDAPRAVIERALGGGRLAHGWLLAGPRGMGKAGFATTFAAHIVDPDDRHSRLIAEGAHPDILRLEREIHPDRKELRRNITIDQVRAMIGKLGRFPTLGATRAVIIDAADDLERGAANALLKALEEPPSGTTFLLVAHSPARLLPTIRSRCRTLRFEPLDSDVMAACLRERLPELGERERTALALLARGSPGRALHFAGLGLGRVVELIERIACEGDADLSLRMALADHVGRKEQAPLFEAALELVVARIADGARGRADGAVGPLVSAYAEATALVGRAHGLTLDKTAVVIRLADLLARVAPHKERAA